MDQRAKRGSAGEPAVFVVALSDRNLGFDEFYKAEYGRIVRLMFGLCGRWPIAEELAQESMMAAHRNWGRVRALDRPDLWVRRVAVNRAISTRRRLVAELAALGRVRPPATSESPPPADEKVWTVIRRLPRKQAAAIVLWAVEGLAHAEIGAALDCSAETARTHIRRARERLQRTLAQEVDE